MLKMRRSGIAAIWGLSAVLLAPVVSAATETTLYAFKGQPDGAMPWASLTHLDGAFYGTTLSGGVLHNNKAGGTVFKITAAGVEKVLYAFKGGKDGASPQTGLTYLGGKFYGATGVGGQYNKGTIFSLTPAGIHTVLYSFKGGADGANPSGNMIAVGNLLYGVTHLGGASNKGTVFRIRPNGAETVLHAFGSGKDGAHPISGLTEVSGTLWGTAPEGGATGNGIVFSMTPAGREQVVYSFKGGADGNYPSGGLVALKGKLYGTTAEGGSGNGVGSVYSLTPRGVHTIIHAFTTDGAAPNASMVTLKGALYGIAPNAQSAVFKVSAAGAFSVVYSFNNSKDGAQSQAPLIAVGNSLYGTNSSGGPNSTGTVFKITP